MLESFYRYEPNTVTVPASEVEAYVQSYADVTSEFLRRSKYYDSTLKAYVFDYEQALSYYSNPPVAIVNVNELEGDVHVFEMESRYQKAQEDSYTLTVEITSEDDFRYISNSADVHPHTENDPPKPIFDGFSQLEKFWINKTETFNLVRLDLSEPIDGRDTLFFFLYLIQDKDFYDRFRWILEDYTYGFPLADVEQIILERLNLDSFDIETALEDWNRGGSPWGSFTYDSENEILYRDYIGGYGGARSTEVIEYVKNGDEVSITLGMYNFAEGGEIRSLIPQSTFKVDYIITDDSWKVVRSVNEEYTVKHNEKFTKAYAVGNDSIGIDSAVYGLTEQNNLYICEMIDGEQSVTLYMSDVEDIELTEFGKVVPLKDGTAELTSYYDLPNFKTTTIKYENAKSIDFDAYITNDDTVRYYHDGEFHSLDIKAQKLISTGSSGLIILDNVGTLWAYSYKTGTYREVGTDVVDFDFFRGAVTHYGEIWYVTSDGKLGLDHYYQEDDYPFRSPNITYPIKKIYADLDMYLAQLEDGTYMFGLYENGDYTETHIPIQGIHADIVAEVHTLKYYYVITDTEGVVHFFYVDNYAGDNVPLYEVFEVGS